jgi:predicted O-methyltransferase YrrM/bacterioferritin (cytochrome b1)
MAADEPIALFELARPMLESAPEAEIETLETRLPDDLELQRDRLKKLRRQLADCEAALDDLRRQLSEQSARAQELQRQVGERETALAELGRQHSEQEVRAQDLGRQIESLEGPPRSPDLDYVRSQLVDQLKQTDDLVQYIANYQATLVDLRATTLEQTVTVEGLKRLVASYEDSILGLEAAIEEAVQIDAMERDLFDGHPLTNLARSFWRDAWWPELQSIRRISMLHPETLYILRCCAARVRHAVIEVGPYIGGSTIALGRGIQLSGAGPLVSVEMGGSHPTKDLPTDDIITDLKRNVETYGLTGLVHIMEGFTTDPKIDAAVNRILAGRPIDLLFLDADGNVERDFEFYRARLNRGAILVFDDYLYFDPVIGAPEKQTMVKAWVDASVASGLVENLGVYRWGSWVGRYRG